MNKQPSARAIVVMGIAGSGKSTIGRRLAGELGFAFCDADDLHPPENIAKMQSGAPLDDADRAGWLAALRDRMDAALERDPPLVLACSALNDAYRAALGVPRPRAALVYLRVTRELATARILGRKGHFMPASLVPSQLATLEEPAGAIVVDGARPEAEIVRQVRDALGAAP